MSSVAWDIDGKVLDDFLLSSKKCGAVKLHDKNEFVGQTDDDRYGSRNLEKKL